MDVHVLLQWRKAAKGRRKVRERSEYHYIYKPISKRKPDHHLMSRFCLGAKGRERFAKVRRKGVFGYHNFGQTPYVCFAGGWARSATRPACTNNAPEHNFWKPPQAWPPPKGNRAYQQPTIDVSQVAPHRRYLPQVLNVLLMRLFRPDNYIIHDLFQRQTGCFRFLVLTYGYFQDCNPPCHGAFFRPG